MVKFSAGFALSALSVASADIINFTVRIRNQAFDQPFSSPLIVAHTNDVSVFREGFPSGPGMQLLAEEGDRSVLIDELASPDVAQFVCGTLEADLGDSTHIFLGDTYRGTLTVDTDICPEPFVSVVSMLINTNDCFFGIDAERLNVGGSMKLYPPGFDAGTEANTELCPDVPGFACPNDGGGFSVGGGEGYIHVHRGFHGINVGLVDDALEAEEYDWRNPVAEVFIVPQV